MNVSETKKAEPTDGGSKEKIISAARDEFVEFGLAGARVDRIARRANINKAMIYYYYRSKEKLYHEVVSQAFHRGAARLKGRLGEAATIDQVLFEFAGMHTHLFGNEPGFRTMALRELASPTSDLLDQLAAALADTGLPEALQKQFEAGMKSGTIKRLDSRQVMAAFISLSLGYLLVAPFTDRVWNITDKAKFLEDRKQVIVDIFLNGVRTK
jgi:AcrR family transcriptional regulator